MTNGTNIPGAVSINMAGDKKVNGTNLYAWDDPLPLKKELPPVEGNLMQEKTIPAGTGIISYDAFDRDIRNETDNTTENTFAKYFKKPPFADQIYKHSKLWHVYVGEDSITRAEDDYKKYGLWHRIAAMALPFGESPSDYCWSIVEGKTIDILSCGKYSSEVYELGCALHQSGAAHVYGRVNGNVTHWHSQRLAA